MSQIQFAGSSKDKGDGITPGEFHLSRDDFRRIAAMLHDDAGIHLTESKAALVYSRLAKRLRALGLSSFRDYCALVSGSDGVDERQKMLAALTTNVTRFFREPHHFQHLEKAVLPPLLDEARRGGRLRLWSAACSNGQEPYSIALTILSLMPDAARFDVKVLASDIDPNMLAEGQQGIYAESVLEAVPAKLRARWFVSVGDAARHFSVAKDLRDLVVFRELNLFGAWPMKGRFQAIFCRNVAIYFEEEMQMQLWSRFVPMVSPGGRLYIGHSERLVGTRGGGVRKRRRHGLQVEESAAHMTSIRVFIVDDSATVRGLIRLLLDRDPKVEVIGEAADPHEARAAIKALNPDVITLDVEMPKMNGLEFLDKIMRLRPTPVIMVSSQTSRGADAAIAALEMGAFDCVAKPASGEQELFGETLLSKVKAAAGWRIRAAVSRDRRSSCANPARGAASRAYHPDGRVVAIGASTGGVEALIAVLSHFPENCPPTVITQHMPATFTKTFAERLHRLCKPSICEAFDGAPLQSGRVYLAPGGTAHLFVEAASPPRCRLSKSDPVNGHRPSVDVLFHSIAKTLGSKSLGVILTGMGRDGAEGLLAMKQAGASTLGQTEASCLIYGMPKAAFEIGATQKQVDLNMIASEILRITCAE
jgi:chemotaxis response regulator CheB/chemotaxis methyl-accepting protein methylase